MLGLGPIASKIPAAVLAGILITVGIGVMDYKGLKAIPSLPRDIKLGPFKLSSEVLIMLIVLLLIYILGFSLCCRYWFSYCFFNVYEKNRGFNC